MGTRKTRQPQPGQRGLVHGGCTQGGQQHHHITGDFQLWPGDVQPGPGDDAEERRPIRRNAAERFAQGAAYMPERPDFIIPVGEFDQVGCSQTHR